MFIGEVAKRTGLSIDAIRYYEREGLITPVHMRESGYRDFDNSSLDSLHFIIQAKEIGFSLKQIKHLLLLKENPDTTCAEVRELAQGKLNEVGHKIKLLKKMEQQLNKLLTKCEAESNGSCPIIEELSKEE
tara:strand:- start:1196 stop:1588 length:393 start_codon:yes stop_codon:yes gene_type:complete